MNDFRDNLDDGLKRRVWERALSRGGDFAEVFIEDTDRLSFQLRDGSVIDLTQGRRQGAGLRVVSGEVYGYAWLDGFSPGDLMQAAGTAAAIAQEGSPQIAPVRELSVPDLYPIEHPLSEIAFQRKMELLKEADAALRDTDKRIYQVIIGYAEEARRIRVVTSDGADVRDEQPLMRVACIVVALQDGKRKQGFHAYGGRVGREVLEEKPPAGELRKAADMALTMLQARPMKGGPMPVILGPGWGGVLLHEAVGHGLEGDFNFKGSSLFANKIGKKVASELVTVVDDATIPHHRGSINIDDEGTVGSRSVLIEEGVLRGYMHDRISASQLNVELTGNGRRQSYTKPPVPRMTNTFMLGGDADAEDVIAETKSGLLAKTLGGGQVDIASGDFVFDVQEGYLIENGEIAHPVENATLIGNGPKTLAKVDMVAADFSLCTGVGTCGKNDQAVPCGVGEPTLRVSEMTVGGRG